MIGTNEFNYSHKTKNSTKIIINCAIAWRICVHVQEKTKLGRRDGSVRV